jgi:hypothetical protein
MGDVMSDFEINLKVLVQMAQIEMLEADLAETRERWSL